MVIYGISFSNVFNITEELNFKFMVFMFCGSTSLKPFTVFWLFLQLAGISLILGVTPLAVLFLLLCRKSLPFLFRICFCLRVWLSSLFPSSTHQFLLSSHRLLDQVKFGIWSPNDNIILTMLPLLGWFQRTFEMVRFQYDFHQGDWFSVKSTDGVDALAFY